MGSTNRTMAAKNRKVRIYDMKQNNYVNNNITSLEYKYHECTPPADSSKVRKHYTLRMMYFQDRHQEEKFEIEYAKICARIMGSC